MPALVAAARGEQGTRLPVWFMRQAGRSLPEYRELRVGTTMLESCSDPEMIHEITMQPVRRHGVAGGQDGDDQVAEGRTDHQAYREPEDQDDRPHAHLASPQDPKV